MLTDFFNVLHNPSYGPTFGAHSLDLKMNKDNASECRFQGCNEGYGEIFNVSDDDQGNSVLTGEGGKAAKFTCIEIEVF